MIVALMKITLSLHAYLNRFHGFDNSKIIFYELTHAYLRMGLTVVRALSRRGLRLDPLDQVVIEIGKVSIFSKY